jgi:hypothetical protein
MGRDDKFLKEGGMSILIVRTILFVVDAQRKASKTFIFEWVVFFDLNWEKDKCEIS